MGRPNRKFHHYKKPVAAAASATTIMKEYRAPTVSLEDQVFIFGKAKEAAKFEIVK